MAKNDTDLQLVGKHKYRLRDGRVAVNVTAISGLMDDGKSSAMAGAAAKITKAGGNYRKEWDDKAKLGTRIHTHFETWLAGDEIDCLPDEEGYLDGLSDAMVQYAINPVEVEAIMLSDTYGYGGRCDLFADTTLGRGLIDLKTGKKYAASQTLQLSAYRYADGIATYDATGALSATYRPVPEVDYAACLFVGDDGSFELIEYPADRAAFRIFTHLIECRAFNQEMSKQFPYVKETK